MLSHVTVITSLAWASIAMASGLKIESNRRSNQLEVMFVITHYIFTAIFLTYIKILLYTSKHFGILFTSNSAFVRTDLMWATSSKLKKNTRLYKYGKVKNVLGSPTYIA